MGPKGGKEELESQNNLLMLQMNQLVALLKHKDEQIKKKDDIIKKQQDKIQEQLEKIKLSANIDTFASINEKLLKFGNDVISKYCMKDNRYTTKNMNLKECPIQREGYINLYEDDGKEME